MSSSTIVVAGANGDLGGRIVRALVKRGVGVRAIMRRDAAADDLRKVEALGASTARADVSDVASVAAACAGTACVVSALNGLRDVIVGRQGVLLDGAIQAGVPPFISSDFAADFTKTRPGDNRNFDLRREFMARADEAAGRTPGIRVTSILNGAFMDMLGGEMPIIQTRLRRAIYWGGPDQPMDFTTKDDVAAFTAAAALDADPPRVLRIAGDSLSPRGLADAMTAVSGRPFKTQWVGGIGVLTALVRVAKLVGPKGGVFPPYQGMQYLRDMMSGRGKLDPLDNDRYAGLSWTNVRSHLARLVADAAL